MKRTYIEQIKSSTPSNSTNGSSSHACEYHFPCGRAAEPSQKFPVRFDVIRGVHHGGCELTAPDALGIYMQSRLQQVFLMSLE
jgi:hypothetical protein